MSSHHELSSFLEKIVIQSPEAFWPKELWKIGWECDTPEEKSARMQGDVPLMVGVVWAWDHMQGDLRSLPGGLPLEVLLEQEIEELNELGELEERLANVDKEKCQLPQKWYKMSDAKERYKVASEAADVLILVGAILRQKGLNKSEALQVFLDQKFVDQYSQLITEMYKRIQAVGMDPAEVVILKTMINAQHRPPALWPEWRQNGFIMKKMRQSIGDETSQIPDLAMGPLGETVLARLQAPEYWTNSYDVIDLVEGELAIPVLAELAQEDKGRLHFLSSSQN